MLKKLTSHLFAILILIIFSSCSHFVNKNNLSSSEAVEKDDTSRLNYNKQQVFRTADKRFDKRLEAAQRKGLASPLSNDKKWLQDLTGKPVVQIPTREELLTKPLSTQHYYAGLRELETKQYINAIKHFNTVLKKYPRSAEVKWAFAAKAKVYNEMGLAEPAQLNSLLSKKMLQRNVSSTSVPVQKTKR